jgi:hypothetical protein
VASEFPWAVWKIRLNSGELWFLGPYTCDYRDHNLGAVMLHTLIGVVFTPFESVLSVERLSTVPPF